LEEGRPLLAYDLVGNSLRFALVWIVGLTDLEFCLDGFDGR
jgi:hypothetical protein